MKLIPLFATLLALAGSHSAFAGHSAELADTAVPVLGERHVYKHVSGRSLALYVLKPDGWRRADRRPALVFFHGGGWTHGAPSQFNEQAGYFAARGLVCVQVEYRLLQDLDSPPEVCIMDANSAMRWVRAHAGELGIDPDRIGAAGGSAGGHLAAFVGMMRGFDDPHDDLRVSPKANALVLFNPVFDNGPDGGWGVNRIGARYREFSPAENIRAGDPPMIVFLGTADKNIPVAVARRFQARAQAAGVRCELVLYPDQVHGFFNRDPWKTRTLRAADAFLISLGWRTDARPDHAAGPGAAGPAADNG